MPTRPKSHTLPRIGRTDDRPSSSARGYGADWRRYRLWFLRRHPLCVACAAKGLTVPACHVDHVVAREAGGSDDESNLQALCASCHSAKTVRQDGGFGRPRSVAGPG